MRLDLSQMTTESRVASLTLLCCSIPYLGLRLYLWRNMHASEVVVSAPSPALLATMAVLGGLIPAFALAVVLRSLIRDRDHFRLRMLVEIYLSLVVIFASGYGILQASSVEPSFSGIPLFWEGVDGTTLEAHVQRLHEVFLDALYLSVITISTVGFGDIVPLSPWAKILSALEGVVGIGFMGIALYAGLSLSVVRMVPVALSLTGTRLVPVTTFFLGWFGPRGLASILFGVIIVERAEIPHRELILAAVLATALASIFAHGLSASPAARRYGRRLEKLARGREMPEHAPVTDLPVRVSDSAD